VIALAVQLAVDRGEADREVVALLPRLLGWVIAALGVLEPIQTGVVTDAMAVEQLPQAGLDPSAPLDVRHARRTLHRRRRRVRRAATTAIDVSPTLVPDRL
jgi:hypothetical protein